MIKIKESICGISEVFFQEDVVAGAILGSIIIPFVLFFFRGLLTYLIELDPKKRLFSRLRLNRETCSLYFVKLFDVPQKNEFAFFKPDYFPPHTSMQISKKINTPYVWAEADGQCAVDVINALGNVGKIERIEIRDPAKDWDLWEENIICIGGSSKVSAIYDRCKPETNPFASNPTQIIIGGELLQAIKNHDYGVIQKLKDPGTGYHYWVVVGLGGLGTRAAGYYLRNNFKELGKIYEDREFCLIIQAKLDQGPASAKAYRIWPNPWFYKMFFHPFLWKKYRDIGLRIGKEPCLKSR